MVQLSSNSSSDVLQIIVLLSKPNILNFDSSDQITLYQYSTSFLCISLENLSHFSRSPLFTYGILQATRPNNPNLCALSRTVSGWCEISCSFSSSVFTIEADFRRLSLSLRWIYRSVVTIVFRFRPGPNRFLIHFAILYFLIIYSIIDRGSNTTSRCESPF